MSAVLAQTEWRRRGPAPTMAGRWALPVVASLVTAVLAVGLGASADHLAVQAAQPAPQLHNVPAATLARLGITLAAGREPVYCGLAAGVGTGARRWAAAAGCPIARQAAETAARRGGLGQVLESNLARVTSLRPSPIGRNRPAWLVVLRTTTTLQSSSRACQNQAGQWIACFASWPLAWTQLVVVDARSGSVLRSFGLSPTLPAPRAPRSPGAAGAAA